MRLIRAHITNFKLLKDLSLEFSTDLKRPLTVIRAENGSGKTSILYALRWAMYGEAGIPQGMRLTSTATPTGDAVQVQVMVEFTTSELAFGEVTHYRLIRTCYETPGQADLFTRTADRLRLLRQTDRGEEQIEEGQESDVAAVLPFSLADVFFTNGDDVQRFISGGTLVERQRQEAVHRAIRQLLGLDNVEAAESLLSAVAKKIRRELTSMGGEHLKVAQEELDSLTSQIERARLNRAMTDDCIAAIDQRIREDEKEFDRIKGLGDLDAIQERIRSIKQDINHLEQQENDVRCEIKALFSSEAISRAFLEDELDVGLNILEGLATRNAIPGHSVEVLLDRLELGICICGAELCDGEPAYIHVSELAKEQRVIAPKIQRLTELRHVARNSKLAAQSAANNGSAAGDRATALLNRLSKCRDLQKRKADDLRTEEEKRRRIDVEKIQILAQRVESGRRRKSELEIAIGESTGRLNELEERRRQCNKRVEEAERQADLNVRLSRRSSVAQDLFSVASGTLARLKSIYIRRVSDRMNDLFLEIVGADRCSDGNVFTGVSISDTNHDIVIHSLEGRTLDADTELNGASQRALTLSLIWALMEVAEREAPRIIDSPLGMTSGAVKQRMVEVLSKPSRVAEMRFQVILFMTRSEIRGIESIISERAGAITTLTCSKDFPKDLVNDWSDGTPTVGMCECNHLQICPICERREDIKHNRFTRRK